MRDRLIKLIQQGRLIHKFGEKTISETIADWILADGWIRPPCKVGDVVYAVSNNKVYKTKVFSMVAETEDKKWVYIFKCNIFNGVSMFKKFLFGKTVFLTREEAEQALKGGVQE